MIARIIQFSLVQRLFVLGAFIGLTAFGINAWLNLPVDAFPDISPTQVKVIMKANGMTAEEVEAYAWIPPWAQPLFLTLQTF